MSENMTSKGTVGKLTKPAWVGNTSFAVGVDEQLVIDRAQREYEYQQQHEQVVARLSKFGEFQSVLAAAPEQSKADRLFSEFERAINGPASSGSQTPRTDTAEAACGRMTPMPIHGVVVADFARTLERELSACRKELEAADVRLGMEKALNDALSKRLASRDSSDQLTSREDAMWRLMQKAAAIISATPASTFADWGSDPYKIVKEIEALNLKAITPSPAPDSQAEGLASLPKHGFFSLDNGRLWPSYVLEKPGAEYVLREDFEAALRSRQAPIGEDEGCICKGNWRSIVKEYAPLIGKEFFDTQGRVTRFFGIVHSDDDFYYGMYSKKTGLILSSCVGSLEQNGYGIKTHPQSGEDDKGSG